MTREDGHPESLDAPDPNGHFDAVEWQRRLDGVDLPPARLSHLAGCGGCAVEERSLRAMASLLSELPLAELPPGLSTRILSRLAEERDRSAPPASLLPPWLTWWGRPLGLASAAALLLTTILASQIARRDLEVWSPEGAWLVGLPAREDPLALEWSSDFNGESSEEASMTSPVGDAGDSGDTGQPDGTGS